MESDPLGPDSGDLEGSGPTATGSWAVGRADDVVPMSYGDLAGQQCAAADVAVVEGFEEVVSSLAREGGEPPVVEYEEPGSGEPLHQPGMRAVPPGEGEFVIGRAAIEAVPENRRGGRSGKRRGGGRGAKPWSPDGPGVPVGPGRSGREDASATRPRGRGRDPCLRGCGVRKGDDEWRSMDPDLISVDWDRGRASTRAGPWRQSCSGHPPQCPCDRSAGSAASPVRGAAFRDVGGSPPYTSPITTTMSGAFTR